MSLKMLTRKNLVEEYKKTHSGSQKLHKRSVKAFSANGATHAARILDPFRPYITHAKGSRKWDVDGNEYIDYVMGHGALILGHSYPAWVQAIQEQVAKGVLYGENHELEVEWAELIKSMMPVAERVEFCACGQEANMMAIRLARIFTGRKKVLRFEENFHGWGDEISPEGAAGVVAPEVKILPMNDLDIVEAELAKKEYAIVITEGGGAHMAGQIPWDVDFIRNLSSLTQKYGTLWLIDEVVTGFREDRGGWQAILGVKPDLTTLGKCTSGGLAVGTVVGGADIFEAFNPNAPVERRVSHSGTWNANPLLSTAGITACKLYQDGKPQENTREIAGYLREQGNRLLKRKKISGCLYGRTIIHFYLGPLDYETNDPVMPPTKDIKKVINPETTAVKTLLALHLLHRGVATMGGKFFILSAAHSQRDVDQTMKALDAALDDMVAEGILKTN